MKKNCLLLVLFLICSSARSQNQDTSLISITNFRLESGTFSWRGSNTFFSMNSWDTQPYTEGHLQEKSGANWVFRLNYRLLHPKGYDPNFKPGYPILLFLHGAGERGNCWNTKCYCEGCVSTSTPDPAADPHFLNNDHHLLFGGQTFLSAVNLAGTKKINDPSLHAKAFPGFVLFPQNENSWGSHEAGNSPISYALRILRILINDYQIDPDRIYIAGLSVGGQGVYKALNMADWLFAGAITMSAINFADNLEYDSVSTIPLWAFQGGHDTNPRPDQTETLLRRFREAGGIARFTLYSDLGHNTWSRALNEPDFISWLLQRSKADIHVKYDNPNVCKTNGAGAELVLAEGFPAYQWEYDGEIITDAGNHIFIADKPGTYRARFSRVSSPANNDWNEWSAPVTIAEKIPESIELRQIGTTYLRDLNDGKNAILKGPEGKAHYYWYKDGELTNHPDSIYLNVPPGNCGKPCSNEGHYSLVTADFDNCPTFPSDGKNVFFEGQAPIENEMRPTSFTATLLSSSTCFLSWDDPSSRETAYEVWRLNTSRENETWTMAAITKANITFFRDSMLIPNSTYHYKIRALSNTSRSDYYPGNDKTDPTQNLVVVTPADDDQPFPPQNLTAERIGVGTIKLTWEPGKDESGINDYQITYNGTDTRTGKPDTTYTIRDLEYNSTYTFSVKTVDISGNRSAPSNQVVVHTHTTGLFYKHSTGSWTALTDPQIENTWKAPEYTGTVANVSLSPRTQQDYFNFEFEGFVNITTAGDYTFYLNSDEGSRLYIDGNLVVDFDGRHVVCTGGDECPNGWGKPSIAIPLTAGPHHIRIQYFEETGTQVLTIRYNGPDTGNSTILIPDAAFNSGGYAIPTPPSIPGNVQAKSNGLTGIQVSWNASSGTSVEYEIYRATNQAGPFVTINRVAELTYNDDNVKPGQIHYYKLKAVNQNGSSGWSAVVSAKTQTDNEPPTTPMALVAESGNSVKAVLRWEPSTDNVRVAGYEIWANDILLDTTPIPAYEAFPLEAAQPYTFYVVAFDDSGNRSPASNTVNNEVFITDVEDEALRGFSFDVFPNPGNGQEVSIRVTTPFPDPIRLEVRDMMNRQVILETVSPALLEESYSLLGNKMVSEGLYLIVLEQKGKVLHEKVIIHH
ncbi:MAG TPA: fibronectin type III domain-containing protein [Ohtaekwangia sp.]|nr:fibronectin type III domain-containing protein [Ohtaekwangia sp.]